MVEATSSVGVPTLVAASTSHVRSEERREFGQPAPWRAKATPAAGILLVYVISVLGGLTMLIARGGLDRWQSISGSTEVAISFVFLAQVALALVCFGFLVRWVRS